MTYQYPLHLFVYCNFCVQWLFVWNGTRRCVLGGKVGGDSTLGSGRGPGDICGIYTHDTICVRHVGWVLGGVFTFAGEPLRRRSTMGGREHSG